MFHIACPYCKKSFKTKSDHTGKTITCTRCSSIFLVSRSPPPAQTGRVPDQVSDSEPPPLLLEEKKDRPPIVERPIVEYHGPRLGRYRSGMFLSVVAVLLVAVGVLLIIAGINMDVTVPAPEFKEIGFSKSDRVINIGRLFDRQLTVMGGFALVGIGGIVEVLSTLKGFIPVFRRP